MEAEERAFFAPQSGKWVQIRGNDARIIRAGQTRPSTSSAAKPLHMAAPLDLTDIPGAMQKMGWHVAAALLNNWFHYQPKNAALNLTMKIHGFTADRSLRYPDDRINRSTVTLDWILSFPRAAVAFEELQGSILNTFDSIKSLRSVLSKYAKEGKRRVDAIALCNNDVQTLHNAFQFQMLPVDTSALSKADVFFKAMFLHHGVPDDLAGALGGFGLYAAVAEATISTTLIGRITAEVTKVALYMKNPYSFFDASATGSQYLGHWNKDGILLVPEGYAAQQAHAGAWSRYPVQPEGPFGRTFWPVHNVDFREWQEEHNAGGDMILFSDYRLIKLRSPLKFSI